MARGGRRTYVRDANGRFASTPGGGLGAARKAARSQSGRASTLGARSSLKRSRAKLAAKDRADETLQGSLSRRAQKGAVTRGNKGLKTAKVAARAGISGGGKGVISKPKGLKPGALKKSKMKKPESTTSASFSSRKVSSTGKYIPGGTKSIPPPKRTGDGQMARSSTSKSTSARAERLVQRMAKLGEGKSGLRLEKSKKTQARAHTFLKFMSGSPAFTKGANKGMPKSNTQRLNELWSNLRNKKKVNEYGGLLHRLIKRHGYITKDGRL